MRAKLLLILICLTLRISEAHAENVHLPLANEPVEDGDPPEVTIGERLFLETRFAQFFAARAREDANATLEGGDPVMDATTTTSTPLPGPFAGQSMNCRACHLVDEHFENSRGGNRTYADFARRSPLPAREDGKTTTPRNAPALVNASLARKNFLLHFDGEFRTLPDLIKDTLTGRNFGWLPGERQQAIAHVAHIIRNDDGSGALAQEFGGPYRVVFRGIDPNLPPELRLPQTFRIDVVRASDEKVLNTVARLIAAYVTSLEFARDEKGEFAASPYDVFLRNNDLPRKPAEKESDLAYSRRLRQLLENLTTPRFVTEADGGFTTHDFPFVFGSAELDGLKIFLREPSSSAVMVAQGRVGNCLVCHPAPNFTDFAFHNTGVAQEEYDAIHGSGTFMAIAVPDLGTRRGNHDAFLPPTERHPHAQGPFLTIPSSAHPGHTDLGLWNVFANPDFPRPQERILHALVRAAGRQLPRHELLPKTLALFKTPGLRDLPHSAPYFHNGGKDTFTEVMQFYIDMSALAREGKVRNADPELSNINLAPGDIAPLQAFLRALSEDYN